MPFSVYIFSNGISFFDFTVYIPEGPGTGGEFIETTRIIVLVLQTSSPDEFI